MQVRAVFSSALSSVFGAGCFPARSELQHGRVNEFPALPGGFWVHLYFKLLNINEERGVGVQGLFTVYYLKEAFFFVCLFHFTLQMLL